MLTVNPVKLLVKLPLPEPLEVNPNLFESVGFPEVFQQTPLAVIVDPPSSVISPPHFAEYCAISDISAVVTDGKTGGYIFFTVIMSLLESSVLGGSNGSPLSFLVIVGKIKEIPKLL